MLWLLARRLPATRLRALIFYGGLVGTQYAAVWLALNEQGTSPVSLAVFSPLRDAAADGWATLPVAYLLAWQAWQLAVALRLSRWLRGAAARPFARDIALAGIDRRDYVDGFLLHFLATSLPTVVLSLLAGVIFIASTYNAHSTLVLMLCSVTAFFGLFGLWGWYGAGLAAGRWLQAALIATYAALLFSGGGTFTVLGSYLRYLILYLVLMLHATIAILAYGTYGRRAFQRL